MRFANLLPILASLVLCATAAKLKQQLSVGQGSASCAYSGSTTTTATLVYGRDQVAVGTTSITISATELSVTYNLDSTSGCTLDPSDDLHVNLVSAELSRVIPGQFPCKVATNGGLTQTITCPLSSFTFKCCGPLLVYTHAALTCPSGSETAFSGESACAGIKRWCNIATIQPPCTQCGVCDEVADRCLVPSMLCTDATQFCNTNEEVCTVDSCIRKEPCGMDTCSPDLLVCDPSECQQKVPCGMETCNPGVLVCDLSECQQKVACGADTCNAGDLVCNLSECQQKVACGADTCNAGDLVCAQSECQAKVPCPGNPTLLVCDTTTECCPACPKCHKRIAGTTTCGCEIDPTSPDDCDPCDANADGITGEKICDDFTRPLTGDDSYKCCPRTSTCKKTVLPGRLPPNTFDQRSLICAANCGVCDNLDGDGNGPCTLGTAPIALTTEAGKDNSVDLCSDGMVPV